MKNRIKYAIIKIVYMTIDVACIYVGIFATCVMRPKFVDFPFSFTNLLFDPQNPYRFIFLLWILTALFFMNANSLYQTRREMPESLEIWLVVKSVFFSTLITVLAIYALQMHMFPRTIFMNITFSMFVLLSLWRVLKRWFVEYLVAQGYNNFKALVIGAGKVGIGLVQEIANRPGLGIKVVGFLDD